MPSATHIMQTKKKVFPRQTTDVQLKLLAEVAHPRGGTWQAEKKLRRWRAAGPCQGGRYPLGERRSRRGVLQVGDSSPHLIRISSAFSHLVYASSASLLRNEMRGGLKARGFKFVFILASSYTAEAYIRPSSRSSNAM